MNTRLFHALKYLFSPESNFNFYFVKRTGSIWALLHLITLFTAACGMNE